MYIVIYFYALIEFRHNICCPVVFAQCDVQKIVAHEFLVNITYDIDYPRL